MTSSGDKVPEWTPSLNATFPYQALPGEDSFRAIRLLPGDDNSTIECELVELSLDDELPEYEGLSYAWWDHMGTVAGPKGPGLLATAILLDGQRFVVSQNLFFALANLRRAETPRLLWVDALCINQADLAERSAQVAIMRRIYENATRTVVWLGIGDSWTERGINFCACSCAVASNPPGGRERDTRPAAPNPRIWRVPAGRGRPAQTPLVFSHLGDP